MRVAYKKEKVRIVGVKETGLKDYPFIPERTPVNCAMCGERAWAVVQVENNEPFYVTTCLKGCEPVKYQLIPTEPLKVKQK